MINELVKEVQAGSVESLLEIIQKFNPLIKKYSYKSFYKEDMQSILTMQLIQSIKEMKCQGEAHCISFIQTVIRNKFLNEIQKEYHCTACEGSSLEAEQNKGLNDEYTVEFQEMIQVLDLKKRRIVYLKFVLGYSDQEIAEVLHVSRQAVHKQLKQAYECIKKTYLEENKL